MHQVKYLQSGIQDFQRGAPTLEGWGNLQTCCFATFCRKLHENERIWTKMGSLVYGAPLNPPLISLLVLLLNMSLLFNFSQSMCTKLADLTKWGSGRKTLMWILLCDILITDVGSLCWAGPRHHCVVPLRNINNRSNSQSFRKNMSSYYVWKVIKNY